MYNMKNVLFLLCLWNICLLSQTGGFTTNFTDSDSVYIHKVDENVENNTSFGIKLKGSGDNQVKVYFTNNLIVQNNSGGGSGVGVSIENIGEVYFSNAVFNNNEASGFSSSGAALSIIDVGTIIFNNTSFTDNNSSGLGSYGGAVYIGNVGNANFLGVEFNDNKSVGSGGALYIEYAESINFENSSFTGNDSEDEGGAIYIENVGNANFLGVEFNDNKSVGHGGALYIEDIQSVNFENSSFINNISDLFGGAIYAKNTDNINLSNVEFNGNKAVSGGAISFRDVGNANFSGVIFSGNESTLVGGAISMYRVDSSSFLNVEFKDNISGSEGGAIYMKSSSGIAFNNTLFEGNQAVMGGGIFMDDIDDISIINSKFLGNVSTEKGGAIYLSDVRDINFSNISFESNESKLGGALYVDRLSSISFNSLNFIGNTAQNGGAIYTANGSFGLTNIFFDGNTASGDGGAIYIEKGSLFLTSTSFVGNSATENGGAISIKDGSLTLTSTSFVGNSATKDGGAISIKDGSLTLNTVSFISNESSNYGGALDIAGGISKLSSANFIGNSALNGGAIHLLTGSLFITNSMFVSNTSTLDGGALYVSGGEGILDSVTFFDNKSTKNGGVIYQSGGSLNVFNSTFMSNTSIQNGGALSASGGNGVYSDSLFVGNSALNGGALSVENMTGGSLEFNDVNFIGNTATGNGGAVYINGATNSSVTINASDGTTSLWYDNIANGKDAAIYIGESDNFELNFNAIGNSVIDINGSITSTADAENLVINKTGTGSLYLSGESVFNSVGTKINVHEGTFELASDAKIYLNGDNSSLIVKEDAKFVFTVNKDGSALIIGGNNTGVVGDSMSDITSTGTTVEISSDNDIDFSIDEYLELGKTKTYKIIENADNIIMNSGLNYEYTLLYDVELILTDTDMSIIATRISASVNLPDLDDSLHDVLDDYNGGNDFIDIALGAGGSEAQKILLAGTQIARSSGSLQIHNTLLSTIESEIVYSFNSVQTMNQKEMIGRNVPVGFSLIPLMLNSKATHEQGSLDVGSEIRAMGTAFVIDVELPTYFKNGLGIVLGFGGAESFSIGDYASTKNIASFFTTGLYYYMEDNGIKSIFTTTYLGLFNDINQDFGGSAGSEFYSQGLLSSVNVSYDFKFIDFLYVTSYVGVNYLFYHQEAIDTKMAGKTILETTAGSGHNIYIPIGVSVSYDFDLKYDRGIITPLLRLGVNIPAYNSGVNTSILVDNNSGGLIDNTLNVKEDIGIMDINAELSWRHNNFTLSGDYTFRAFVDHYSHLASVGMKYFF